MIFVSRSLGGKFSFKSSKRGNKFHVRVVSLGGIPVHLKGTRCTWLRFAFFTKETTL